MSMAGISTYLYLSCAIDLTSGKKRHLRFSKDPCFCTVLMSEKRVITFSADCLRRLKSSLMTI